MRLEVASLIRITFKACTYIYMNLCKKKWSPSVLSMFVVLSLYHFEWLTCHYISYDSNFWLFLMLSDHKHNNILILQRRITSLKESHINSIVSYIFFFLLLAKYHHSSSSAAILLKFIQFTLFYWNFGWIYDSTRILSGNHISQWNPKKKELPKNCRRFLTRSAVFCSQYMQLKYPLNIRPKKAHVQQIFACILQEYDGPRVYHQIMTMWLNKHAIAIEVGHYDKQFSIYDMYVYYSFRQCELIKNWIDEHFSQPSFSCDLTIKGVTQVFDESISINDIPQRNFLETFMIYKKKTLIYRSTQIYSFLINE